MVFKYNLCAFCRKFFKAPADWFVVYCSAECRYADGGIKKGCYPKKYRRVIYSAGDSIDPLAVFDNFDWICHLCNQPIDPARLHPDKFCATIDHLTPLGQGGGHVWDNVAPAHKICNERKSFVSKKNSAKRNI